MSSDNYLLVEENGSKVIIFPDGNRLTLDKLDIEVVGIQPNNNGYNIILLTSIAIKKLQMGVTEKLETIGLPFRSLEKAIAFQNIITLSQFKKETDE